MTPYGYMQDEAIHEGEAEQPPPYPVGSEVVSTHPENPREGVGIVAEVDDNEHTLVRWIDGLILEENDNIEAAR